MRGLARLSVMLLFVLAGCGRMSGATADGWEFGEVELSQTPPELQAVRERLKMVPGLYAFQEGGQTYLLVCAGRMASAGLGLEVLEVKPLPGNSKEARLLAAVKGQPGAGNFPCAAVAVEGGQGYRFKARISTGGDPVVELHATPLTSQ